jgi:hypothetical protein
MGGSHSCSNSLRSGHSTHPADLKHKTWFAELEPTSELQAPQSRTRLGVESYCALSVGLPDLLVVFYTGLQDDQPMNHQLFASLRHEPMAIKFASVEQVVPYPADQAQN